MSRPLRVPPELTRGPFTRATALRHVTARQLRHPVYRVLTQGVYIVTENLTHGDKIRGARLVLPAEAILVGRSALWALGVDLADAADLVEVCLPADSRVRRRDLLHVTSERIHGAEVVHTRWGPATTPARTAFDLARREDPLVNVPLLDALVRATGVRRREVEAVAGTHAGVRWLTRIGPTLDLVDEGAESYRESLLRVLLVLAGLPRPRTQVRVYNEIGQFVARVDLGWVELRVAVEYDGVYHDAPAQVAQDRARLNALRAAGWTVIVIDRKQLARPDEVVELIRRVLAGRHGERLAEAHP